MTPIQERLVAALAERYRLERELGQGGMATVYLAEDLKHRRQVAIKVLKTELAAVLGADRFVQEIATTASLQHPHILPLFDSGTADGAAPRPSGGGEGPAEASPATGSTVPRPSPPRSATRISAANSPRPTGRPRQLHAGGGAGCRARWASSGDGVGKPVAGR
jgi:Protein kinase domain